MSVDQNMPAIILVRPQLGENIGKVARAMLNFGFNDLRMVAPRDGWPNISAYPAASGADRVLDAADIYATAAEAIADCHTVFATTVRPRGMVKDIVSPESAAGFYQNNPDRKIGILFGREAAGLDNDDIALADKIITIPTNPDFGSLNIAQAVILVAYAFFRTGLRPSALPDSQTKDQATKAEINLLVEKLEQSLADRGWYRSDGRKDVQRRTLVGLFQDMSLTSQQVQTFHGIFKTLVKNTDS